jgi:hypothetical protein
MLQNDGEPPSGAENHTLHLDLQMRRHYAIALKATANMLTPVIHAQFDECGGTYHLRHHGKVTSVQPVPKLYQLLKSVSHTVLGLYATFAPHFHDPNFPWKEGLRGFHDDLVRAIDGLHNNDIPEPARQNCREILRAGADFAASRLAEGSVTLEDYTNYARSITSKLLANVEQAAAIQVDAMTELLQRWKAELGEADWNRLNVVVTTAWSMREENVHFMVFEQAMGKEAVNKRLFLAEGFNDTEEAFDLLGRIVLDRSVSVPVFDDTNLLDRELMGPGARKRLDERACPVFQAAHE